MSWEFFMQPLCEGDPVEIDEDRLFEILKRDSLERVGDRQYRCDFLYDDGFLDLCFHWGKEAPLTSLMIKYMCGPTALLRLFEASRDLRLVVYWPDDDYCGFAMCDAAMIDLLPAALKADNSCRVFIVSSVMNLRRWDDPLKWEESPYRLLYNTMDSRAPNASS